jgi:drug/metabolite transporter (DMT)-like permease
MAQIGGLSSGGGDVRRTWNSSAAAGGQLTGTAGIGVVGRAILINLAGVFLLDVMGLIIKHLSGHYSAPELSTYRNLFGMAPSLIFLWLAADWQARGRPIIIRQWPLALLRGSFVTLAQFLFYLSLARLAFATATTIGFSMALFTTALSVPLLGNRVGAMRWLAVGVGFAGVVMVMGPGSDGFGLDALLPLGAAFFYALVSVSARMMDDEVPSPLVNLYSNVAAMAGAVVLCLATGGFSPIASASDLAWIVAMGSLGGVGVLCLVVSFRMTEPSDLAPFSYFGILYAFVLGWVFFGEAPVDQLFPGALLIVAGGLMIVWRERRKRRHAVVAADDGLR